jgi:hypothetical protein
MPASAIPATASSGNASQSSSAANPADAGGTRNMRADARVAYSYRTIASSNVIEMMELATTK